MPDRGTRRAGRRVFQEIDVSDLNEKEQVEWVKEWLRTNGLWIIAGIAIGAAAIGGWRWYGERQSLQAEAASARYEELMDAFARNDRTRAVTIADDLNREHAKSPYAPLATLLAARIHVEMIARLRLARVQEAQGKYDDALATLKVEELGEFATRFAEVRGDVLLAKGDRAGALREYLAARSGKNEGRVDLNLLDLKIRDLGGTPPPNADELPAAS
jgi:predicted negative regulator of RcsB-dependent stress response